MASALFDSLLATGGGCDTPPNISEAAERMIMTFVPNVKLNDEVGDQQRI